LPFLLLNDLVWGLVCAYDTVGLVVAAPTAGGCLNLCALVLLAISLVTGSWNVYRSRRRPVRTS
jgi:hypothetical protein